MREQEQLTGYSQRGYTGRMSESSAGVLEGDFREREHQRVSEAEAKRAERRERRIEGGLEALNPSERREPHPPEMVLRKKENWIEIGWSPESVNEITTELQENLRIDEDRAYNALEILVASGQTPQSVRERLTEWQNDKESIQEGIRSPQSLQYLNTQQDVEKYHLMKHLGAKREGDETHYENIRDDYIQRFVLDKEFHDILQREYDSENPGNLNELAWNIHFANREDFGINGKFPVIEMRVDKDKNGNVTGKYCINKANYMKWIRKWINYSQDKDPDGVTNYFGDVKLDKQLRPVSLGEIIDNQIRYFTDEDGAFYSDISNQSLMEPWMMMTIKDYDVAYKSVMADGGKLTEQLRAKFQLSKLTKKTFNKSMLFHMATMGVDFDGAQSDSKLGGAWNTMFLAYYNISDFDELEKVLGKDSSFFKKEGFMKAIDDVIANKRAQTGAERITSFLGEDAQKKLASFYDEKGNLKRDFKTKESFTTFINFLASQWADPNLVDVINGALKNAVKEMYDFTSGEGNKKANDGKALIDDHSFDFAVLIAQTWIRFSGAGAKNDIPANGFDAASKWLNTESYRRKMATEKRGGSAGNPYTIPMFKGMMVDLVRALRVSEATTTRGVHGRDNETATRKKTMLEVLSELNGVVRVRQDRLTALKKERGGLSENQRERANQIDVELQHIQAEEAIAYKQLAGQLEFPALAMANYAANHVDRAAKVYDQIMGAKEIDFDKWTKHDIIKGVTFDRATFQKDVQEDFLKPLRYLWATYGELNFNMPVRVAVFVGRNKDERDIREYRTIPLGEALFGYQMMDIPEFRKRSKDVTAEALSENGWKKKGKYVVDKDGRHIIDYDKVQKDQTTVWKQWALMKFAGDLWTHIDRHSSDPSYDIQHYLHIIEALERIPAGVDGTDKDMRDVRITKSFFSHSQMKWLRRISKTDNFNLYRRQLIDDIFGGGHDKKGSGFGDSASLLLNAIFRGY